VDPGNKPDGKIELIVLIEFAIHFLVKYGLPSAGRTKLLASGGMPIERLTNASRT